MLGEEFSAGFFRSQIEGFFGAAPDGWPCWSFSNHDCIRHVSRWKDHAGSRAALAKQTAALLLSLEGSVCLYQGEEFGLPEADLQFEELVDPKGITYWPADKGRDGCRVPIPWVAGRKNADFSSAEKTWLPVKPEMHAFAADQHGHSQSVLRFYRQFLAFRRDNPAFRLGKTAFIDLPEPFLAFLRDDVICCFNLSPQPGLIELDHDISPLICEAAERRGRTWSFGPNGFVVGKRLAGSGGANPS
jgi:alpha-glucosidase